MKKTSKLAPSPILNLDETKNELSFTCNCKDTNIGQYCQFAACPCENGNCVSETIVEPNNHRCICLPNYTGKHCQTLLPPCDSNPCQGKNSKCEDIEIFNPDFTSYFIFECLCDEKEAFTGKFCENEINPCLSLPCEEGYQCRSAGFSLEYECECKALRI